MKEKMAQPDSQGPRIKTKQKSYGSIMKILEKYIEDVLGMVPIAPPDKRS